MDNKEIQNRIRQERFVKNNGTVIRGINIFREKYVSLSDLQSALSTKVNVSDFIDCVNYLEEGKFIKLRRIGTELDTSIADTPLEELEAKLSVNGIRLMNGKITDPCIEL